MEKNLIINNRTLTYQGLFRVNELFQTLNQALENLGYQKQEKKTEETVSPSGKQTLVELRPFKIKSSYLTLAFKIKINLKNITETVKEVDQVKRTFQQGEVIIVMDAWSLTDHESRWGMKPLFYFLKAFINKYIYHFPLEEGFIGELKADADYLTRQLKAFLSLYKYQVPGTALPQEETSVKEESPLEPPQKAKPI